MYALWVSVGIAFSFVVLRFASEVQTLSFVQQRRVNLAAAFGAILGAYLFELPADLMHWTAAPSGADPHSVFLGGRTVLGGLLGGWWSVEAVKKVSAIRVPTGDRFALPLAIGLTFGRLGCVFAGCCAGAILPDQSPFERIALRDGDVLRFPASLVEVYFHASAAVIFASLLGRDVLRGRRLAVYFSAYAVLRFVLEYGRINPLLALGLTYYQWLAMPLFLTGIVTFWRRTRRVTQPPPSWVQTDGAST